MTQEQAKTASLGLNPFQQALMDELEKYRHQKFIGKSLKEATDRLETAIKQSYNPDQIMSLIKMLSEYQEKPKVKKTNPTKGLLKKNFAQHEIKFDTLINHLFDKIALEFVGGKGHKALAEQHNQITDQLADLSTTVKDKQTMLIQALLQEQKLTNMLSTLQASAQAPREISALEKLQNILRKQGDSELSSADIETAKSSIGTLMILIRTELVNKTDVDPTVQESANKLYTMSQLIGHVNSLTAQYNSGSYETCKNEIAALNELFNTMEDTQELKSKTKALESSMTVFFDVKHKILEQCFLSQVEKLSDLISAGKENLQPTYPFYNQLSRAEELIKYGYYMDAVDLLIKINPQDVKNPEIQPIIATIKEKADLLYNALSADERTHIKKIQQDPTDAPKINWLNALNTDNPKDPSHRTFFSECQNTDPKKSHQLSKTLDTIIDYAKNHPNPQVREAALKALEKIIKESQNDTNAGNAVRQVIFEQYQNSQNKPFLNDLKTYFNGCSLDADILDHLCVGFKNPLTLKKDESIKYTKQELEGLAIPIIFNIGIATIFAQIEKQYNSIAKEDDKKNYLQQSSKFIDAMITSAQSDPKLIAEIESGLTQLLQTVQAAAPNDSSKYQSQFDQNIAKAKENKEKIDSIATRSQPVDGDQQLAGLAQTAKGDVAHTKAKQLADDLLVGYIHHISQIKPTDFHKQKWNKGPVEERPHLYKAIEHFNALSNMVVADILNATAGLPIDRTLTDQQKQAAIDVSLFYINVVEECLKNKDFESAKAIWSGLKSSEIMSMKLFDDTFPGKDRLQKIDILYGNTANFKRIRDEVAKANSSGEVFITSIGLVCTDYTFIDDGNPTRLPDPLDPSKNGPLNPKKMALLANSGFQPLQAMHARLLKHADTMPLSFQTNLHSHIAASNDLLKQYKELAKEASALESELAAIVAASDSALKSAKLEVPNLSQATTLKQRAEIGQQHLAKILAQTDLLDDTRMRLEKIKGELDDTLTQYSVKTKVAQEASSSLAKQIIPSTILNVENAQPESSSTTVTSTTPVQSVADQPKTTVKTETVAHSGEKNKKLTAQPYLSTSVSKKTSLSRKKKIQANLQSLTAPEQEICQRNNLSADEWHILKLYNVNTQEKIDKWREKFEERNSTRAVYDQFLHVGEYLTAAHLGTEYNQVMREIAVFVAIQHYPNKISHADFESIKIQLISGLKDGSIPQNFSEKMLNIANRQHEINSSCTQFQDIMLKLSGRKKLIDKRIKARMFFEQENNPAPVKDAVIDEKVRDWFGGNAFMQDFIKVAHRFIDICDEIVKNYEGTIFNDKDRLTTEIYDFIKQKYPENYEQYLDKDDSLIFTIVLKERFKISKQEKTIESDKIEVEAKEAIHSRPRRGDDVSRQPPRPNTDILPQPKAEELEQGMDSDADELFSVIDTTHTIKESLSEEEQSEAEEAEVRPRAMHPESPPVFVDPLLEKRAFILKEFAATEESYLKSLSYIADNEKSIHSIVEESTSLSEEQKKTYKEFISILKSIHSANKDILVDLESLRDLYDAKPIKAKEIQETIEQIQKKMKVFVPFYGRHSELLGKVNTPEFLAAFAPKKQESTAKKIDDFLIAAGSPINCSSIGITPTQRYPRYRLLTEDLLKNTTAVHPAYAATSELLGAVLKSADKINAFVKARERVNNIGQFLAIKADNPKLDSKKTLKIVFADLPIATSSTALFEQLKDIQNSGEHPIHFELQENKDIAKNSIRIYLDPHKEAIATISILKENVASNPKIIIETKKNNLSYDALEVINGIANYLEDEFKKSPTFTSKDPELVKLYTLLNDSKAHTVELASPATQDSSIAANDPLDPDEKEEMQKLADVLTVQYTEPKDKSKKSTSPHVAILNPESKSSLRTTPLSSLMDEEPPLTVSLEDQPTSHVLTSVSKMTADPIPLETDPSVIPIDESLLVNNEEAEEEVVDAETTFDMPSTSKAPSILPPPLPIGAVVKELQSLEGEALDAAITKHLANMNAIFTNQKMPMPAHDTSKSTAEIGKLYLDALEAKQKENDSPILKGHIQLLSKILEIQKEKAAALSSEKATHRVDETPPIISRPRAHSMPSSTTSEPSIERKRAASFSGDTTPIWKKPPSSMSDKPSDKKSDTPIVPQNPSTFTNDSTKAKTKRPLGNVTIGEQRIKAQTHAQTDTIASQVIDPHSDAKVDPSTVTSQVVEPRSDAKADPPTVISQVVEPRSDDRTDSPTVISQSDTTVSVEPKGEPKSPPSRRETPLLQQKIGFPPMVIDEFGQSQNLSLQKLHDFAQAHQKAFDIKEIKKFPEQQNEGLKGLEFVFQRDKSDSKPVSAYATTGENQNVKFSVSKSLFTHDQDAAQEAIWKMCRLAVNAAEPNAVFTIPEKMSPPEKREMVKACFERAIQEALEKPNTKFTTETIPKVVDKAAEDPRKDTRLKGG